MSAFDATIRASHMGLEVIPSEDGKAYEAQLVIGILAVAPLGPEQALPIQLGVIRVPLDKAAVGGILGQFQSAHDALDERTNIVVTSDLAAVERAAEAQKQFARA